ncbi:MAG TPA: DsbA family protein [Kofleriaceae bacterium]|nr:DsbA family protein [Kofleriaceae bacterium]
MTRPLGGCAAALVGLFLATSCGNNNSSANTEGGYKDVTAAFDESETPAAERKPVEGADLSKLASPEKQRFEKLVDKLPSPCGKAHSLRTSRNTDAQCIRARFAVDYVLNLLADGAPDEELTKLYAAHYRKDDKKYTFRLSADVPHQGPADARVVLVEFFDFGCPACHDFWPELAKVVEAYPNDVVVYYKQFPLGAHPDSRGAAQAALAVAKQGKYHEMHDLLFQNPESHKKEQLVADARSLGLDMGKFESDYGAMAAQVEADKKEGEEAGVDGTPTLFINGRKYGDPAIEKYVKMWIEEELAVNR